MTTLWRSSLLALRRQFEDGAARSPGLMHSLVCALQGSRAEGGIANYVKEQERATSGVTLLSGESFGFGATFDLPGTVEGVLTGMMTICGPRHVDAGRSIHQLGQLAGVAGQELLPASERVWGLFTPAKHEPELGVANRLWLHDRRRLVRRDVQVRACERHAAEGMDTSAIPVPEADYWVWREGRDSCRASMWWLAVYNLAWRRPSVNALKCKRYVGLPHCRASFEGGSDLRLLVSAASAREPAYPWELGFEVRLPLEMMWSELPFDPFMCSVYAIDILLATDESASRSEPRNESAASRAGTQLVRQEPASSVEIGPLRVNQIGTALGIGTRRRDVERALAKHGGSLVGISRQSFLVRPGDLPQPLCQKLVRLVPPEPSRAHS